MQYLKNHYTVNWDAVHKAHNERIRELRTAFKTVVLDDCADEPGMNDSFLPAVKV